MQTDKMLQRLTRMTEAQLGYRDYAEIEGYYTLAGPEYDTSKLQDVSRERIVTIFNKHFEVQ
jgi:hypothetical protein